MAFEGMVNPNFQASSYYFEYATEEATVLAGHGARTAEKAIAAGNGGQPAYGLVERGLEPETAYFYRLVATDAAGTTANAGPLAQATTLIAPTVTTNPAQEVTETRRCCPVGVWPERRGGRLPLWVYRPGRYEAAFLENGGFSAVDSLFDPYARGLLTPENPDPREEDGAVPTDVLEVGELTPGTTYHYAVIAGNGLGSTTIGPDRTFTTLGTAPAPAAGTTVTPGNGKPAPSSGTSSGGASTASAVTMAVSPSSVPPVKPPPAGDEGADARAEAREGAEGVPQAVQEGQAGEVRKAGA